MEVNESGDCEWANERKLRLFSLLCFHPKDSPHFAAARPGLPVLHHVCRAARGLLHHLERFFGCEPESPFAAIVPAEPPAATTRFCGREAPGDNTTRTRERTSHAASAHRRAAAATGQRRLRPRVPNNTRLGELFVQALRRLVKVSDRHNEEEDAAHARLPVDALVARGRHQAVAHDAHHNQPVGELRQLRGGTVGAA